MGKPLGSKGYAIPPQGLDHAVCAVSCAGVARSVQEDVCRLISKTIRVDEYAGGRHFLCRAINSCFVIEIDFSLMVALPPWVELMRRIEHSSF